MKNIHPRYDATVFTCTCGASFRTRSTVSNVRVEVCAVCHPFYSGRQKYTGTGGRIARFRRRSARGGRARSPA